jgi:hypothetical protein
VFRYANATDHTLIGILLVSRLSNSLFDALRKVRRQLDLGLSFAVMFAEAPGTVKMPKQLQTVETKRPRREERGLTRAFSIEQATARSQDSIMKPNLNIPGQ